MVAPCVRMPCPGCSHDLRIRVEDLGREGGCKHCGHRFRAGSRRATVSENEAARLLPGNQSLERALRRTWALLITTQASIVEQLLAELGDQLIQPRTKARKLLGLPLNPVDGPGRVADPRPAPGEATDGPGFEKPRARDLVPIDRIDDRASPDAPMATNLVADARFESSFFYTQTFASPSPAEPRVEDDSLLFPGGMYAAPSGTAAATASADMEDWIDRLAFQRDEARAECARLREEISILRSDLSGHASKLAQLRPLAEQHQAVLDALQRLNAERDMLVRETAQLRILVVELQIAMVQAESERRASDRLQRAEIDRLNAALDDAESAPSRSDAQTAPIRALPSPLARPRRERAPSLQPQPSGGPPD